MKLVGTSRSEKIKRRMKGRGGRAVQVADKKTEDE